ncbi:hypothetical protein [Serratia aquatilis]|uniref:Uncharacterized protein n=1 Tax=Serratia aquatilis TaxID=1737515 RepID=A0ABV6ECE4_9GAMM
MGLFFTRCCNAFAGAERVEEQPIITSPVKGIHMNFSQWFNTLDERLELQGEWLWGSG